METKKCLVSHARGVVCETKKCHNTARLKVACASITSSDIWVQD